jgi:hypothetical protein
MIPHTKIGIPTPLIIYPLPVQPGLLYIIDEDGPTRDLPCNVNVIPRTINIRPTTINDLPMRFFIFINCRRPNIQMALVLHQLARSHPHWYQRTLQVIPAFSYASDSA